MKMNRFSSTILAAAMGAIIIAPIQPLIAQGAPTSATMNTLPVSSASLIVFASATQSFTNTGVALNVPISSGSPKTFYINNSGTISINAFAFIVTLPQGANVSYFKRCPINVAFIGNNTCASGSPTTVSMTPGVATSYVLSLPANSFYSYQIDQSKNGSMIVNTYANTSHRVGAGISHS